MSACPDEVRPPNVATPGRQSDRAMEHDALETLRKRHPAWILIASRNSAMVLNILNRAFVVQARLTRSSRHAGCEAVRWTRTTEQHRSTRRLRAHKFFTCCSRNEYAPEQTARCIAPNDSVPDLLP